MTRFVRLGEIKELLKESWKNDEKENDENSSVKLSENLLTFLQKPIIPHYESIPEATPSTERKSEPRVQDENAPIPGFDEFRKYKRVNETRVITPYKPESVKLEAVKSDAKVFPAIEIENPEGFLLEKIKSIPVQSLESLLQMIHTYPEIGFVTMNRHHMDLLNDYQPYSYAICNYNDKDESNYVTISPNGLVEFYKGDPDFMHLDRLPVEYELYCALQKIPLFSNLRRWKAFMVWFKKIRRKKFINAKTKIEAFFSEKFQSMSNKK